MKPSHSYQNIPRSRIATFDVYSVGLSRHHISAVLEFDVTESRRRLRELRRSGIHVSFNAWLIKTISMVLHHHKEAAAYIYNKRKLIIFDDIRVSIMVEKKLGDHKVPLVLLLERTHVKSAREIDREIEAAKSKALTEKELMLHKKTARYEQVYFYLPGFLRRALWRILLGNPGWAYNRMGNVIITSVGMMGKINGWFLHKSIHPISFGIGSVLDKPVVLNKQIIVREVLNMTILCDHDLIDGAPMVRLLNALAKAIESGEGIIDQGDPDGDSADPA
jgi:pyruvate/2-oxoglutarate dehydrogenase complex dihydrolipoamide acyltransferase (E2) component